MKKVVSLFLVFMFSCFTSAHAFFGFNKKAEEPKGIEYYVVGEGISGMYRPEFSREGKSSLFGSKIYSFMGIEL
jgi:hypothetical protein